MRLPLRFSCLLGILCLSLGLVAGTASADVVSEPIATCEKVGESCQASPFGGAGHCRKRASCDGGARCLECVLDEPKHKSKKKSVSEGAGAIAALAALSGGLWWSRRRGAARA